ncbi:MAG: transposase [Microcoleus sp. PH2017_10_PVI_O_A]|uniref:RNA-guided endonuclease InsQ/TnpB family protein n=1 Tax=unclassified Microcoleus TaxID=2642155 RepID=UPI001E01AF4B|nr:MULTISPECIES: RNA-guided endonuclease TnpB family protein [unclassified Microcoleus]TAE85897.1 MAG: transposase [Oscillatoriales cyanobacterium]MCC3404110.1 transposase [Microcoleus sp. PH2017_10_PVI_O_A]MCC3458193.1 transposase [Microcoleus sp. PH2017_11_PCY_U_A]MCC3476615.1 transposase [Microcoleus sp. PH2017_12_PCY_D_A]MCC3527892.1 transposase [Microcoleus sp. PH2017_21_RUC_O_A]
MYQAYKLRIYPTTEQQIYLAGAFGCCRWFWNYSLNLCQETYKTTGKGLTRGAIQGLLPHLKKEYPWLKSAYSQCLQVVALNLSTAYKNFFDKRAGYPSFKSKHGRQSISYPQNVKLGDNIIKLPIIGELHCRIYRKIEGTIKTVTISKNTDGKYYASVLVDDGQETPEASADGKAIGLDVGLRDFCVTSDGSKYANPRHLKKHSRNLKRKQQKLSRKQKGSNRRNKARKLVAKVHSKVKRVREDFLHKLSRKIVNKNQVIAVENLKVKGLIRNHCLAKAISDAGWGMFGTMLKYKAEKVGKLYIEIDRFFPSSKTCNNCLHKVSSMPLDVRHWNCPKCGSCNDRDINAAKNIRDEALRIWALGTSASANRGDVSRGGKPSVLSGAIPREVGSPQPIGTPIAGG